MALSSSGSTTGVVERAGSVIESIGLEGPASDPKFLMRRGLKGHWVHIFGTNLPDGGGVRRSMVLRLGSWEIKSSQAGSQKDRVERGKHFKETIVVQHSSRQTFDEQEGKR